MANGTWIRLYKRIRSEACIQNLPPERFKDLINVWTLAGDGAPFGRLSQELETLAWELRKTPKDVERMLDLFRSEGLLDEDEETGLFVPHNWDELQLPGDRSGAERQKRHRERVKANSSNAMRYVTDNVTRNVTDNVLGNVTRNVVDIRGIYSPNTKDLVTSSRDLDEELGEMLGLRDEIGDRGMQGGKTKTDEDPPATELPSDPKPKTKRKTKLPDAFKQTVLTEENVAWALGYNPALTVEALGDLTDAFIDRNTATGEGYINWVAAWRNWVRNDKKWGYKNGAHRSNESGITAPDYSAIGNANSKDKQRMEDAIRGSIPRASEHNPA